MFQYIIIHYSPNSTVTDFPETYVQTFEQQWSKSGYLDAWIPQSTAIAWHDHTATVTIIFVFSMAKSHFAFAFTFIMYNIIYNKDTSYLERKLFSKCPWLNHMQKYQITISAFLQIRKVTELLSGLSGLNQGVFWIQVEGRLSCINRGVNGFKNDGRFPCLNHRVKYCRLMAHIPASIFSVELGKN